MAGLYVYFSVYIFSIKGPSGQPSELYLYHVANSAANHSISSYLDVDLLKH